MQVDLDTCSVQSLKLCYYLDSLTSPRSVVGSGGNITKSQKLPTISSILDIYCLPAFCSFKNSVKNRDNLLGIVVLVREFDFVEHWATCVLAR